jgi:phage terminase large subunit
MREYDGMISYSEAEKAILFPNGSRIALGYCAVDRDALRYQGQEYDVIAIDEATQLSEFRFSILKACLRGSNHFPRRMYLTCNPGGIGHSWVKRLFVDRDFRNGEDPRQYKFIPARVYDNPILTNADPEYVRSLESLPPRLRDAWLHGRWDVFEGQFFPEFDRAIHVVHPSLIPSELNEFVAFDYGFDMLAVLLVGIDADGNAWVTREVCRSGLTLSAAARQIEELIRGAKPSFAVCSPDLWNRRQDSGLSGAEIMQRAAALPPMCPADDRRVAGWRVLREYLSPSPSHPFIRISSDCTELIECLPALLCDPNKVEDASGEPHRITHAPEALRYALMSRASLAVDRDSAKELPIDRDFKFNRRHTFYD